MGDVVNNKMATELAEIGLDFCNYYQGELKEYSFHLNIVTAKLNLMIIGILYNDAFLRNKDEEVYKKLEKQIYNLEEISKSWNM